MRSQGSPIWAIHLFMLLQISFLCNMKICQDDKGPRVINGNTIVAFLNEDVIAPSRSRLLLNSTLINDTSQNLCLNRTETLGSDEVVYCSSNKSHLSEKNANEKVDVLDGFLVLKIRSLKQNNNALIFTWWSSDEGFFGQTMIIVILDNEASIIVCGKKHKTISLVLKLDCHQCVDIALYDKNASDIYNYQLQSGRAIISSSRNPCIRPYSKGSFYITTFLSVDCSMVGDYTFIATRRMGFSSKVEITLEAKEDMAVDIHALHQPAAYGDYSLLMCNSSGHVSAFEWVLNGNILQTHSSSHRYEVTNTARTSTIRIADIGEKDIGEYSCQARTSCDVFQSDNMDLSINEGIQKTTIHAVVLTNHIRYGDLLELQCRTSGRVSFDWRFNRTTLQVGTKYGIVSDDGISTLTIYNFQPEDIGVYSCKMKVISGVVYVDIGISGVQQENGRLPFENTVQTDKLMSTDIKEAYSTFITDAESSTNVLSTTDMETYEMKVLPAVYKQTTDIHTDLSRVKQEPYYTTGYMTLGSEMAIPDKKADYTAYIISAIIVGILVIAIGCINTLIYAWKRFKACKELEHWNRPHTCPEEIPLGEHSNILEVLTIDLFELDYRSLQFDDDVVLGRGEFGVVQKAVLVCNESKSEPKDVAVKCLREDASSVDRENFLHEAKTTKSLQSYHPNIVKLLGYCTQSDPVCIILELAPHGNLKNFLLANRSKEIYQNVYQNSRDLTSLDLIYFGWQIAKGMSFIASKKFIHRDLAARNVLVWEKRCCKISDFGFARDVSTNPVYHSTLQGRLPIRWMALESLSLVDSVCTIQSDVWSYGIVLWEIATLGSTPYANMTSSHLIRKLPTGYRLPRPDHCSEKYYGIMSRCWHQHPESRPSFSDLSVVVGKMSKDTKEEYMTMENFDSNMYVNITPEQWPANERM